MSILKISKIANAKLESELKDDLGKIDLKSDITTFSLLKKISKVKAKISNREEIVLCGEYFLKRFINKKFNGIKYKANFKDGQKIKKNSEIILLNGDVRDIFLIERTILNFIQHLSSIATQTSKFVKKLKNSKTKLLDTRKTATGMRFLEKYATKIGGALNHRVGLFDKILVKDNHIKFLGGISATLNIIKKNKIKNYIIECDSFHQVQKCIEFGSKYILLDNMGVSEIKKCVNLKKTLKKNVTFEISGGINLKNLNLYSKLDCDFISSSKITNSPKSVDIGLDII